jgi:hypothetical protein
MVEPPNVGVAYVVEPFTVVFSPEIDVSKSAFDKMYIDIGLVPDERSTLIWKYELKPHGGTLTRTPWKIKRS